MSGATPTLAALAARGTYGRAVSVFPSLTPVCLSSIATGAHGDVHEIPHLVWYHRGEAAHRRIRKLVRGAVRAAGIGRTLRDTLVNMNAEHLGRRAVTLFEALADAGLRTAAVNFTAYRGRTTHRSLLPLSRRRPWPRAVLLLQPVPARNAPAPRSPGGTGRPVRSTRTRRLSRRWLVTRDGVRLPRLLSLGLRLRLARARPRRGARHARSAATTRSARSWRRPAASTSCWTRYAVVVMADHGQTTVRDVASLETLYDDVDGALVCASNRAAHVYALDRLPPRPARARHAPRRRAVGGSGPVPRRTRGRRPPRGRGAALRP